jgi:hypothetical protein
MKHEFDDLLRAQARRELREVPSGLAAGVRARLVDTPMERTRTARALPLGLAASLVAAGLLAYFLWPRTPKLEPQLVREPAAPNAPALVVDLTRKGIQYASRIERPLADEWQLMVQNSLQVCDSLLGQLPNLPR